MTYLYKEKSKILLLKSKLKVFLLPDVVKRLSDKTDLHDLNQYLNSQASYQPEICL